MSESQRRFQVAQRRLNLVKLHAHEIVGVKREQVNRVVENFSKPGTYDITVHENGKVFTHQWTPPDSDDFQVPMQFPPVNEEAVIDEVAEQLSLTSPAPSSVISPEEKLDNFLKEEETRLAESQKENPPAPEAPAAPRPRGRGRPKKA